MKYGLTSGRSIRNTHTTAVSVEKSAVWRHCMRSAIVTESSLKYPMTMIPHSVPKSPSATLSWSEPRKNGKSPTRKRRPFAIRASETVMQRKPSVGMNVVTAE